MDIALDAMNRTRGPVWMLGVLLLASAEARPNDASPTTPNSRMVYQQHCAACHGQHGEGAPNWRRPNQLGELPAPPHDSEGHTWRHADAELYRMVSKGWRDPFNKTQRLTMPAFETVLSPTEIWAVIAYLKTMWTPTQRAYQEKKTKRHPLSDR